MAISEFVKRKVAMAYYRFDHDKDGLVTEGDFVHPGQEATRLRGVASSRAAPRRTRSSRPTGVVGRLLQGADTDGDDQVTLEEYLAFVGAWVGSDPEAIPHAIQGNQLAFDTIDGNGDGKLSLDEFSLCLRTYGLTDDNATRAFGDLNLDGYISRAEFAKNMSEYYISEERPSTSEWSFGGH